MVYLFVLFVVIFIALVDVLRCGVMSMLLFLADLVKQTKRVVCE
jgi:hypothetical protein